MKLSTFFLLFVMLIAAPLQARQSSQLQFDEANTLLEEGDYMGAMEIYHVIEQSDEVSGALFLNMGIASMEIDSMGLAKYYFLKAAKFETSRESAEQALDYVESQFSRQSAVLPKLPWDKAVDVLKNGPGATGVFLVGFVLILVSVSVIILHWFRIIAFKKRTQIIAGFAAISLLTVVLAFYVDYIDRRYHEGVVTDQQIQVTQQPSDTADLVSLAYEGYTITIDKFESDKADGWSYIRLGNGQFGWIKSGGAKIL